MYPQQLCAAAAALPTITISTAAVAVLVAAGLHVHANHRHVSAAVCIPQAHGLACRRGRRRTAHDGDDGGGLPPSDAGAPCLTLALQLPWPALALQLLTGAAAGPLCSCGLLSCLKRPAPPARPLPATHTLTGANAARLPGICARHRREQACAVLLHARRCTRRGAYLQASKLQQLACGASWCCVSARPGVMWTPHDELG